jgi:hypothetical protein
LLPYSGRRIRKLPRPVGVGHRFGAGRLDAETGNDVSALPAQRPHEVPRQGQPTEIALMTGALRPFRSFNCNGIAVLSESGEAAHEGLRELMGWFGRVQELDAWKRAAL